MRTALYPGTFDPVTIGHLDVVARAARIFDRLVVGVGDNPEKACVFSLRERLAMMRREVGHLPNVEVKTFRGLMVDFAKAEKVSVVLRGIRTVSDLEYEIQMAFTNRASAGVETVFIAPSRSTPSSIPGSSRRSPRRRTGGRNGLARRGSGAARAAGARGRRAAGAERVENDPARAVDRRRGRRPRPQHPDRKLAALRQKRQVDFCIANVENASGGSGLTPENAREILAAGVDVMTMGDHVWKRKEIIPYIEREPRLLRPQNFSPLAAGTGVGLYTLPCGVRIAVLDLLGRVFMKPVDDPFRCADEALRQARPAHAEHLRGFPRRGHGREDRPGLPPRRPRHVRLRHAHARADRR